MAHPYDRLALPTGGGLIFTPCPGTKGASLADSLATLKDAGAAALITLMPDDELAQHGAEAMGQACADQGIQWLHWPVGDDQAPDERFTQTFQCQKQQVLAVLAGQGTVVIHCRGGSGRTGFMAALLLLEQGWDWDQVVSQVQGLRPGALRLPVHLEYLRGAYA